MDSEQRFITIEEKIKNIEVRLALAEQSIKEINEKLDKITNNTSKIMWLILASIVYALLNQILKGGIVQ